MALDNPSPADADVFAAVAQTPAMQSLRQRVENGGVLPCGGVALAAQPFFAVLLGRLFPGRPIVAVTEGLKTQESFQQDAETWGRVACCVMRDATADAASSPQPSTLNAQLFFYPPWDTLPHEAKLPHADTISERLETLVALTHHASRTTQPAPLIVTSVPALLQRTFRPEHIRERTRTLRRGDRIDPLDLVEWLEEQGYEPEVQVNHRGEIALRGGIVDIFPLASPWPVRLEFFGDEIESMRTFDPISQISRENIDAVTVSPGGELGILKRLIEGSSGFRVPGFGLSRWGEATDEPARPNSGLTVREDARPTGQPGTRNPEPETPLATFLDHLPPETIFVLCEPQRLDEHAARYAELVPEGDPFFIGWEGFQKGLAAQGMTTIRLSEDAMDEPFEPALATPHFQSLDAFRPITDRAPDPTVAEAQRREFFGQLHRWSRQGHAVHVFCNNEGERERFEEVWKEYGFDNVGQASRLPPAPEVRSAPDGAEGRRDACPTLHLGALSRGFLFVDARLVVVTDAEIFGRYKVQRPRRLKSPHAQTSRSLLQIDFTDLQEGDYVVHLEHGIGRYLGLQMSPLPGGAKKLEKAGAAIVAQQECLAIEYAPRDPDQPAPKLYVPVSESHLVSKYIGAGKARPPLNALGGGRWQKAKEHAERAVRDLASELLAIQAARAAQPGHSFKADTPWQREFEGSFLYEETPDQWKAIQSTKTDMEAARPMDRLICGDVGYGKTEVALRAAFKAVMDGRQVAVLVPTTVLAQQHFNTFRERMADYPIRIELLSRFRTQREQRRTVQDLAAGAVDVVIGTHRLVQEDIAFKDLGLVVIDEEQRFGVLHKEKFKMLRKLVDVLTLSATPIPRTLHLALTGARDMSTIETPPQDRLPVETIVCEFDERVIRDAILRELNRGGQVFYLHNRVLDIDTVAARLRGLLPKARIVVGHGQMDADDLEEVMSRFVNGEADVLLSTTIIESGIDIPNANTIIIDRADRFGLSDLYQLRGRVGRYKHQAYAYLLIPRHARMLTDARKRISAIKQYSTLGSGFKVAMRDLEIRGAGNMLGAQQSGHITAVGFELYCQLLKQSVAALKGEQVKPRVEVQIRLDFLVLGPLDERAEARSSKLKAQTPDDEPLNVSVPREVASYTRAKSEIRNPKSEIKSASASLPLSYVPDARQRIELYRKFAELTDEEGIIQLKAELRDRFGPLPAAVELLLQVAALKVLADERGIEAIESKEERLMLLRNGDFVMAGGKFPRLTKKEPRARLNEIRRVLLSMPEGMGQPSRLSK
ncbi:MAG TPA: transcription-repair coupling factor [Verrucomicrobiae bacterium]|nr:transcription-repair coupling factor [Verrucomicrobiae bacterium]